jgi:DNA invertase Pin-like site-specific DNA recombinase
MEKIAQAKPSGRGKAQTSTQKPQNRRIASWEVLADELRQRDDDPTYADAPVLDAYARISKSPDGDLEKTDRQLSDILHNISARHARLGEVLRDDNLSAWKRKVRRPGWERLMDRLESGTSQGVVCWHTDRLMRQSPDLERLIDIGNRPGYIVGSCFGEYSLDSSDGRFALRIVVASATKGSDDTSVRQKRKAEAMRVVGKLNGGGRAFGFPGNGPDGQPVPDELIAAERDAIASGTRALLAGSSLRAVLRDWKGRGLSTARSGELTPDAVKDILVRARNAGLVEHSGVIVGRTAHDDSIVGEEDLRAVRSMFASRKRGRPPGARHVLSGIARCAICGWPMTGLVKNYGTSTTYRDGEPRRIYKCGDPRGCLRVSIDARAAEAWVREKVLDVLSDPRHAARIARSSAALAEVEQAIAAAEATAQELATRLGEGRLSLDRFDAAMAPLDRRLAAKRKERDDLLAAGAGADARARDRAELAAEWDSMTTDDRRAMIRRAMPEGVSVKPATRRGPAGDAGERMERIKRR